MRIRRIMAMVLMGILLMVAACGAPAPTATPTPPAPPEPAAPAAPPVAPPPAMPPEPVTPATPPVAPPPTIPAPAPLPATPPPAVQGPYEVWIPGREFSPSILTVPAGTKVTWTNKDGEQHTVSSSTGLFDAPLDFGKSFSYTFTVPGTYEYFCQPHPDMTARVIVQ